MKATAQTSGESSSMVRATFTVNSGSNQSTEPQSANCRPALLAGSTLTSTIFARRRIALTGLSLVLLLVGIAGGTCNATTMPGACPALTVMAAELPSRWLPTRTALGPTTLCTVLGHSRQTASILGVGWWSTAKATPTEQRMRGARTATAPFSN